MTTVPITAGMSLDHTMACDCFLPACASSPHRTAVVVYRSYGAT